MGTEVQVVRERGAMFGSVRRRVGTVCYCDGRSLAGSSTLSSRRIRRCAPAPPSEERLSRPPPMASYNLATISALQSTPDHSFPLQNKRRPKGASTPWGGCDCLAQRLFGDRDLENVLYGLQTLALPLGYAAAKQMKG